MLVVLPPFYPHVTRVVDITTSTPHQTSPSIPSTTPRIPHDPFQHQQHPPNVSTSPSSSQLQTFASNSSSSFTNGSSRPHSIERHVTDELLDYRRSPNVSSTPTRAASTTTSCCCLTAASTTGTRRHRRLLDAKGPSFASLRVHILTSTPGSTTSSCSILSTQPQISEEPQTITTRKLASKPISSVHTR